MEKKLVSLIIRSKNEEKWIKLVIDVHFKSNN